ncbi:MAG: hypothetical protein HC933_03080 [Pleurocapsa sp. SU_196_0]|nr:hypothetical protein [Pleurocapsa sp. SU_196_0]
MTQSNAAAFPYPHDDGHYGLSKREYFAVRALQGLLADHTLNKHEDFQSPEGYATCAVDMADALIAALNEDEDSES